MVDSRVLLECPVLVGGDQGCGIDAIVDAELGEVLLSQVGYGAGQRLTSLSLGHTLHQIPRRERGRDNIYYCNIIYRGPHRYTRTVRVPIPRPKIPVINRINSSQYFFTGTMNKTPRCWYSRQGGKECRDAGSAGKYIAIASSSAGRHWNCTTIDTNTRSSTWKSVERATLCILHGASTAPPHFSKH